MKSHDYFREKYDREIEMHKFSRIEVNQKISAKDTIIYTAVGIIGAAVVIFGTYYGLAMIYAVSGVR